MVDPDRAAVVADRFEGHSEVRRADEGPRPPGVVDGAVQSPLVAVGLPVAVPADERVVDLPDRLRQVLGVLFHDGVHELQQRPGPRLRSPRVVAAARVCGAGARTVSGAGARKAAHGAHRP